MILINFLNEIDKRIPYLINKSTLFYRIFIELIMCVSLSFYLLSEKLLNDTNQIIVVKQML